MHVCMCWCTCGVLLLFACVYINVFAESSFAFRVMKECPSKTEIRCPEIHLEICGISPQGEKYGNVWSVSQRRKFMKSISLPSSRCRRGGGGLKLTHSLLIVLRPVLRPHPAARPAVAAACSEGQSCAEKVQEQQAGICNWIQCHASCWEGPTLRDVHTA